MLMRWAHLKVKNLILNGFELVRNFRFGFAPPLQIFGKVEGFKMEGTVKGFVPTLLGSIFIVILQEPPVLKLEWLVMIGTSGIENRWNQRVVTFHHWKVIYRGRGEGRTPICIAKTSIQTLISGISIKPLLVQV